VISETEHEHFLIVNYRQMHSKFDAVNPPKLRQ